MWALCSTQGSKPKKCLKRNAKNQQWVLEFFKLIYVSSQIKREVKEQNRKKYSLLNHCDTIIRNNIYHTNFGSHWSFFTWRAASQLWWCSSALIRWKDDSWPKSFNVNGIDESWALFLLDRRSFSIARYNEVTMAVSSSSLITPLQRKSHEYD